mgnify:CR=1 FL=1
MEESLQKAEYARSQRGQKVMNADLPIIGLLPYSGIRRDAKTFLEHAVDRLQLSNRAMHRIVRVSRTIADLGGEPKIAVAHVREALQFRVVTPGSPTTRSPAVIPSRAKLPPASSRTKRAGVREENVPHGSR